MKNRDTSFLQKLKDNAFYVALGLGLMAILAVVAVYTVEQNGSRLASNEVDLNKASDYKTITEQKVEKTNGDTAKKEEVQTDTQQTATRQQTTSESTQESIEPVTSNAGELDFTSDKTITWPVNGEVILPFSMETTVYFKTLDQYQCNPGMMIAAGNGTTVKNAYMGKVTKVTSDDIYGNLVTVYIGNDYSLVYGQLDTIYVKEGDSFEEEGSHLFFEMTEKDTPVDPMLFIE